MTITLPDSMHEDLHSLAKAEGFSSVDAYLLFLVFEARAAAATREDDDAEVEDLPDPPPGASYAVQSREELEAKLEEGMNSGPPIRVTPEFWRDRRKALAERVINRQRRAMSVDFDRRAAADLDQIEDDIAAARRGSAAVFQVRFQRTLSRLDRLPTSAPLYEPADPRYPGMRVCPVQQYPSYAAPQPTPNGIVVLRILHTSRNVAAIFAPSDPPVSPPGS